MYDNVGAAFGWDDEVPTTDGGGEFQLLDEGPVKTEVTEFRRGRHEATARMGACNQAELSIRATDPAGHTSVVRCNLPLNQKMSWKITALFKSLGLIDPSTPAGTAVRYPWDKLVGATGYAEVEHYSWTGDDGQARESNSIKNFLYGYRADEASVRFGRGQATGAQRPYGGSF